MKEKILVIHPGYGKTGSTSFQNLLKFADVNILAKPYWPENQAKVILFRLFREHLVNNEYQITKREYNYSKLKNDFKDYLKKFFKNNKKVSVFSDEGMLTLGRPSSYFGIYNLYIIKEIIEEIENEMNIKIIIKFVVTIRKQHDIMLSNYFYVGDYSESMPIEDYFKKTIQNKEYGNLFNYTWIVKKISKIFNSEILILPLELLMRNQNIYIAKLSKFMGQEIYCNEKLIYFTKNHIIENNKKRYFLRSMPFRKIFFLGSLIHNWLKKIDIYRKNFRNNNLLNIIYRTIEPKEKLVLVDYDPELFKNEIKNLYKNDNLELEKIADINLEELGYY